MKAKLAALNLEEGLVPLTAEDLRRRLQRLASDLAPRIASGCSVPWGLPTFLPVEPRKLIDELAPLVRMN